MGKQAVGIQPSHSSSALIHTFSLGTPKSIPVWRVQSFSDLLLESRIWDSCRAARTIEESSPQEGASWWQARKPRHNLGFS